MQQLELHEIEEEDDEDEGGEEKTPEELKTFSPEELEEFDVETLKAQIALLEGAHRHSAHDSMPCRSTDPPNGHS